MEIIINESIEVKDILVGDVRITNFSELLLFGIIKGNIVVEENSSAIIYGTVNGNIDSQGKCKVYGIVKGGINGNVEIDSNAIINPK